MPQKALALLDTLKKLEIQENRIKVIKEGDFAGELYNKDWDGDWDGDWACDTLD